MMKDKIIRDLKELGICEGDTLLVHSSLRSLGDFSDRARTVTDALLEVIGPKGTLVMPTLSYTSVNEKNPYFDVKQTPSCVGGLTEYFRLLPGVKRSLHPTHSAAAIGSQARFLVADHYKDNTPVGKNSPFYRLKELHGKILFLGCGLKPNTSMHGVEELVVPPYLFGNETEYTLVDSNGVTMKKVYRNHNFKGYIQRYDRIEGLLSEKHLKKGNVLKAECYLIDASAMWLKAFEAMHYNVLYFVEKMENAEEK